jgi:outer membrane lipoprotein carrier protein
MYLKHPILITFFIIFLTGNVYAQTTVNDAKAKDILNKVSVKYKSFKTIRAVFVQKIDDPANKSSDELTGTIYIKGNKYKVDLNSQEIICDNVTIWTYLKDSKEVQINTYEPDESTISPDQIFNIYQKDFLYAFNQETTLNGATVEVIDLTPMNKNKPYFKVRLNIDKNNSTITSAVFMFKDGKKYTFEIQKMVPDLVLNDSFFTFDPKQYPGIQVDDLR